MNRYGIIGHPVAHSKSPKLHQLIAASEGRTLEYELLDIKDPNELNNMVILLRRGAYQGFNITIPYKELIMQYVDELTDQARRIGAVNTLYVKDGKVIGDNTDYDGFKVLFSLTPHKKDDHIVILGSGGAAKAVYQVLIDMGYNPTVVTRKKTSHQPFKKLITYDELAPEDYHIIVNTTPIGMYPNGDESPLDEPFVQGKIVVDLIYNPSVTKLMSYSNCAFNGETMLIHQAIKAQSLWEGYTITLNDEALESIERGLHHE